MTTDPDGVPTTPAAIPSVIIYQGATALTSALMPAAQQNRVTGLFVRPFFIDSSFSAGNYRVEFWYTLTSTTYSQLAEFEVLSSGSTDGAALEMEVMRLPSVAYALMHTRSGRIKRFRNPRAL